MALLVKPEPFTREIDRVFDAFFGQTDQGRRWIPPMDLVEAEDHFVLKADLPGLSEGDVSIEVQPPLSSRTYPTITGWIRPGASTASCGSHMANRMGL